MKKIKYLIIIFLAIINFNLMGCINDNSNKANDETSLKSKFLEKADQVTINNDIINFNDGVGQNLSLRKNFKRVISLYSSFTTLWYEANGTLVGTVGGSSAIELYKEYIGYDITESEVPVLTTNSNASKWSLETILASNPDLIICSTAMNGYKTIKEPAQALEIPVIVVDYENFADYLKWFKVFSFLTDNERLWQEIALKALDEVTDIIFKTKEFEPVKVISLFSGPVSILANTSNTLMGAMIEELGAINIVSMWNNPSNASRLELNLEALVVNQPKKILVACHSSEELAKKYIEQNYGNNELWNYLDAVKNNQVFYLPKQLFHNKPNHRFVDSYKMLASVLYPEYKF